MPSDIVPGTPAGSMTPSTAATVADALARAGRGERAFAEAWPSGDRVQVHKVADEVLVFDGLLRPVDHPDLPAIADAVHAHDAVLDAVVAGGRLTFVDLLFLDGEAWAGRPLAQRLDRLGEIVAAASMLERAEVEDSSWAEAFAEHARARGYEGVAFRRPDVPWAAGPAGDVWVLVRFAPA